MIIDIGGCSMKIGDDIIEQIGDDCKTKFFKFLGHHLDEHLTWTSQLNPVSAKLSSGNITGNLVTLVR